MVLVMCHVVCPSVQRSKTRIARIVPAIRSIQQIPRVLQRRVVLACASTLDLRCYPHPVNLGCMQPVGGSFHENLVHEVVREVAGDLVEEVVLKDIFTHPQTGRLSHCYRINYRCLDRSLTNEEVDELQWDIRARLEKFLSVQLR